MKPYPAENPFPGLRPFEPGDAHLFFGRDGQSDDLLNRFKRTRFVAVVGTSGSGKSSLRRAGLIPALYSGITSIGSNWRVSLLRPGDDPIGNLATALNTPSPFESAETHSNQILDEAAAGKEDLEIAIAMTEATLARSRSGLIEAASQTIGLVSENLLIIVDQFEELFRYSRDSSERRNYGADFVNLLLEATSRKNVPIYVILTMRDEFLRDCTGFWGLPEAISDGQYLIPRMSRNERRKAIEGPIEVARA